MAKQIRYAENRFSARKSQLIDNESSLSLFLAVNLKRNFKVRMEYLVLAYYQFMQVDDPHGEVKRHKIFFKEKDVAGRIYLSEQGINGQMSGLEEDVLAYIHWLRSQPLYASIEFKIHRSPENVFPRMTVKYRKQLVAFDTPVDLQNRGAYVTPQEWKTMLEKGEYLMIDVRNDYESKVGHFKGAELPPCSTFREFPKYAETLLERYDPKQTKVMMYCTGGIRCEIYSAYLLQKGFEEVYQLHGGVIQYGLEEGNEHWEGELFVFDDRLTVTPQEAAGNAPVSFCLHCHAPCSTYLNCANMDCNELFLCCADCAKEHVGCCQTECENAPRLRAFRDGQVHKPFRKKHLEALADGLAAQA